MLLTTTFKFEADAVLAVDNLKFASEFAVTTSPELSRVDKLKVLSLATVTEYLSAPPSFPVSFTFALPPSTVTVSLVPEVNEVTLSVEIFAPALIAAAFKISESVVVESTSTSVLFNVFNFVALNKSLFAVPVNVSTPVVNVPV